MTRNERERAIVTAKDEQQAALDEAKQHADEARQAHDEAAKAEADAKAAEAAAANPPSDVSGRSSRLHRAEKVRSTAGPRCRKRGS